MIPQIIKELAKKVREAKLGKEVRESIAKSMEETSLVAEDANTRSQSTENRQTILENKYDEQLKNSDDVTEVKDAHVSAYDGQTYDTIGKRMDRVDADLAQNESQLKSLETANSEHILEIVNYLGNYQNIHPKVLYFSDGWHGYKFWMGYTPYPFGYTAAENPSIAVSNDMINWETPPDIENPFDYGTETDYNSDTHLVYRGDTDTLELWWRYHSNTNKTRTIYRMTTNDGVNWTSKQAVIESTWDRDYLSPAVLFENGIYKMWFKRGTELMYTESVDDTALSWTEPFILNIDWDSQNLNPWHHDVIKTELGYEIIVTAFDKDTGSNNTADLYYILQTDDTITKPRLIIRKSTNPTAIDHAGIYRSCFLKINGTYYVFYSTISPTGERGIALSIGKSIFGLNGFKNQKDLKGSKILKISEPTTFKNYDVSAIDTIFVNSSAGLCTFESFTGGYIGKKISIVLNGSSASAKIVHGKGILVPGSIDYVADVSNRHIINIMRTGNEYEDTWRVDLGLDDNLDKSYVVPSGTTLTDFDVRNIDLLKIPSGSPVTINSLVAKKVGQVIHVVVVSSTGSAKLVNSSRLLLPNDTDLPLTSENIGVTLICTSNTNGVSVFRGF